MMMNRFFKCLFLVVSVFALSISSNAFGADVYDVENVETDAGLEAEAIDEPSSTEMVVTVTTDADSGKGSLREAIQEVAMNGVVLFDDSLNGAKIPLNSSVIMDKPLTIDASSLKNSVTLVGTGETPVLKIGGDRTPSINIIGVKVAGKANGELVSVSGVTLNMENCQIIGNKNGRGMTVTNASTIVAMKDCTIGGNSSAENGGGLFVGEGAVVKLEKCAIASNTSEKNGGGVVVVANASLTMDGCNVTKNSGGVGGGIFIDKAKFRMDRSTVTANKARWGGGYSDYGNSEVNGSIIAQNVATAGGGGIFVHDNTGTSILSNSIVGGNTADTGGGVQIAHDSKPASIKINGCSVSGNLLTNKDEGFGGGVDVWHRDGATLDIKNSTIAMNKGMGIRIGAKSKTQIESCTITENFSGDNGAGLRIRIEGLVLIRSIVVGNTVKGKAMDIFAGKLSPDSSHNVVGVVKETSITDASAKVGYLKENVLGKPVLHRSITCAYDSKLQIPLYYPLVTARSEFTAIDIIPAEEYEYEFDEITDQIGKPRPVAFFSTEKNGDAGAIEMQPK